MERTGSKPIDELVRLAIIGDSSAFEALWDAHFDSLKIYVRSLGRHLDSFFVEDICSRSFEKAFRQIRSYDPSKSGFSTWLCRIAHNTALDVIERENRVVLGGVSIDDEDNPASLVSDGEDSVLDTIINDEDKLETEKYVEGLPDLYRNIARLRLLEGLQYKEIAVELDMELNTVRTRIRRAKSLMEKMRSSD